MPRKSSGIDMEVVHFRLPKRIVEEIDRHVNETGRWESRSSFIKSAVDKYLELVRLERSGVKVYYIPDNPSTIAKENQ
jgi:Arc/MetJ-type ribon-helix-helix transcriptional regulator